MPRLVIAESAPFASAAKTLRTWINKWLGSHSEKTYREFDFADLAGKINPAVWSKIRAGKSQPSPEQCLSIAYWLGVPVDAVLRQWGYADVKALRALVAQDKDHSQADVEFILTMLDAALESQWQRLNPAKVFQKEDADFILTRSSRELSDFTKAKKYAQQVSNWVSDPQRGVSIGQRTTDEVKRLLAVS